MRYLATIFCLSFLLISNQKMGADIISFHEEKYVDSALIKSDSSKRFNTIRRTDDFDTSKDTINVKVIDNNYNKPEKRNYVNLILPIVTLLVGFFLNRGYEKFAEKRRIRKDGERWIAELRYLQEPIQGLQSSLRKFLELHALERFDIPELEVNPILECEIFKSLDKRNLLKYLQIQDKDFSEAVKLSNNVHGFIGSLNLIYNNLTKRYDEYRNQTSRHEAFFDEHLQLLNRSIGQYSLILEKQKDLNPIKINTFNQIYNLFKEHIQPHTLDVNIELFDLQSKFILPLGQILNVNRLDDDFKEITMHFADCNKEINAIRKEKKNLTENFMKIIDHLVKSKENLDRLLEKF